MWSDQTCVRCVRNDFDELKANILLTLLWSTGEEGFSEASEASERKGRGGADAEKADVEPETDSTFGPKYRREGGLEAVLALRLIDSV